MIDGSMVIGIAKPLALPVLSTSANGLRTRRLVQLRPAPVHEIMIVGDCRTGYTIVDRIGMTMEIIQHLFGPTTASQQASVAHTPSCVRVPMWLRLTRSGISQSCELILVRGGVSFKEA
jgi:hypothetical protein